MNNAFYFVVDENYIPMAAAQASILASYDKFDIHIFIERKDKSTPLIHLIPEQIPAIKRIHYHLDELASSLPEGLPESQKWPRIVYLRIFAPQILKSYSRLVYLDADIAVADDPSALFNVEMPGTIAAVHDYGILGETIVPYAGVELTKNEWLQGIGLEGCRYFNSGMLLINTKSWNQLDIRSLLLEYFDQYGHRVTMFDQDFLNYTFKNDWVELSPRWNFQASLFDYGFEHIFEPCIVHFTAPLKPWNGDFYSYQHIYLSYFKRLFEHFEIRLPKSVTKTRRRYMKRIKTTLRRFLLRHGIQSKRERTQRKTWGQNYALAQKFINHALDRNLFADISDVPVLGEPQIFFDGHFVRTKNLEAPLASLSSQMTLPSQQHLEGNNSSNEPPAARVFREENEHCKV